MMYMSMGLGVAFIVGILSTAMGYVHKDLLDSEKRTTTGLQRWCLKPLLDLGIFLLWIGSIMLAFWLVLNKGWPEVEVELQILGGIALASFAALHFLLYCGAVACGALASSAYVSRRASLRSGSDQVNGPSQDREDARTEE